jgi:hypothetical protein
LSGSTDISSIVLDHSAGRAVLTINYDRQDDDIRRLGVQELYAVDVVRDIKAAPYFAALLDNEAADVQASWDNRLTTDKIKNYATWNNLQKALFGHMTHGQESYTETAYEFRQTFQTTSTKVLKASTANPNTVQTLPELTRSLQNLVDAMPTGEWLKKPTTVNYAGRKGWTVSKTYLWAPKWSVIYGGTFTGL